MKTEWSRAASQYAQALIELAAAAGGSLDTQTLADLETVNQAIANTADFELVLQHPSVPGKEKKALLIRLFQGKIQDLTLRLIEFLCDKRRLYLLPGIESEYRVLLNARQNIVNARLTSAGPLSEEQKKLLHSALTKKLGKHLELTTAVDPSLIGGLVLRIGDDVIDGSVKGKLRALEKSLLSV